MDPKILLFKAQSKLKNNLALIATAFEKDSPYFNTANAAAWNIFIDQVRIVLTNNHEENSQCK